MGNISISQLHPAQYTYMAKSWTITYANESLKIPVHLILSYHILCNYSFLSIFCYITRAVDIKTLTHHKYSACNEWGLDKSLAKFKDGGCRFIEYDGCRFLFTKVNVSLHQIYAIDTVCYINNDCNFQSHLLNTVSIYRTHWSPTVSTISMANSLLYWFC